MARPPNRFSRVVNRGFHRVKLPDCPETECECECGGTEYDDLAGSIDLAQMFLCFDVEEPAGVFGNPLNVILTERSCVVVMAAVVCDVELSGAIVLERPYGTALVHQENIGDAFGGDGCDEEPYLWSLEVCEELDAGDYTWYTVNRSPGNIQNYASWIKAVVVT